MSKEIGKAMTITEKQITVYVASDGSEHRTREAAALRNVEAQLYALFEKESAHGEMRASEAVDVVIRHWGILMSIMDDAGAHAVAEPKRRKRYKCGICGSSDKDSHRDECEHYGMGPEA